MLFDGDCPMCQSLAGWLSRGSLGRVEFASWQAEWAKNELFQQFPEVPEKLAFWDGTSMVFGGAAWERLLQLHPALGAFGWAAQKLGIMRPIATMIDHSTRALRRLCTRCGRPDLRQ